jgi:branched-chain amino acid aminotransferase
LKLANHRIPNTLPAMAKSSANYMNSQLIKMEANVNGFTEGTALDINDFVSEGSGRECVRRASREADHGAAQ